jgi:putative transcriptional regulator
MAEKKKMNSLERDLIEGLEGFVTALKNGEKIIDKFTCRRVVLDLRTHVYTPARVKATRKLLRASQALFAQFLGVSAKTVRAWESGKTPSDIARRFMDEIQRNPDYWRARLRDSARLKASNLAG